MDLIFWHNMREFPHITFDIDTEVRTSMCDFLWSFSYIVDSISTESERTIKDHLMKWQQKTFYLKCHQQSFNCGCLESCVDKEYEAHMVWWKSDKILLKMPILGAAGWSRHTYPSVGQRTQSLKGCAKGHRVS